MKQVVMPFDGKVIETVTGQDGKPWISVRSVCQAIGVDFKTQSRKVQDDERLRGGHITSPSNGDDKEIIEGLKLIASGKVGSLYE